MSDQKSDDRGQASVKFDRATRDECWLLDFRLRALLSGESFAECLGSLIAPCVQGKSSERRLKKKMFPLRKTVAWVLGSPVEAAEHRKRRGKQASIVRASVSFSSFTRASYASARADEKRRVPAGRDRQRLLQNSVIGKARKL